VPDITDAVSGNSLQIEGKRIAGCSVIVVALAVSAISPELFLFFEAG